MVAAVLFVVAVTRYPGGYEWANQSASSLFQPLTTDGLANTARPIAVLSVLAFCVGIAVAFGRISRRGHSRVHRKTIQIAGIGSMVYAFLVVTPMHDTMVAVALVFFVVAILTTFHMLWVGRRRWMLLAGVACMSGTFWNAAMYYGPADSGFLPLVQKASTVLWVTWLFLLYFSTAHRRTEARI